MAFDVREQIAGAEIVIKDIETLLPYPRNSRTHTDAQIQMLAGMIREYGFTTPLLLDADNGIIAGHGRLAAARLLGLKRVPCIELAHLSEAQKRALVIADNKSTMVGTGWDEDMLRIEFGDLSDMGFDLSLTGFSAEELDEYLASVEQTEMPELNQGEREPYQQMTFTLHDDQVEVVKRALGLSLDLGEFTGTPNTNKNGNALARICQWFEDDQRATGGMD